MMSGNEYMNPDGQLIMTSGAITGRPEISSADSDFNLTADIVKQHSISVSGSHSAISEHSV